MSQTTYLLDFHDDASKSRKMLGDRCTVVIAWIECSSAQHVDKHRPACALVN